MKLYELFDLIKNQLNERYGEFKTSEIYDFAILIFSQVEVSLWKWVGEEEIVAEKDGIKIKAKLYLYKDDKGKYSVEIFIPDIEIIRGESNFL